jgi:hypothetical protein
MKSALRESVTGDPTIRIRDYLTHSGGEPRISDRGKQLYLRGVSGDYDGLASTGSNAASAPAGYAQMRAAQSIFSTDEATQNPVSMKAEGQPDDAWAMRDSFFALGMPDEDDTALSALPSRTASAPPTRAPSSQAKRVDVTKSKSSRSFTRSYSERMNGNGSGGQRRRSSMDQHEEVHRWQALQTAASTRNFNTDLSVGSGSSAANRKEYEVCFGMMLGLRTSAGLCDPPNTPPQLTMRDFSEAVRLKLPPGGHKNVKGYTTPPHKMKHITYNFKDYAPRVFRRMREEAGIDSASYMLSVCHDQNFISFSTNSKSGCGFMFSHDGR